MNKYEQEVCPCCKKNFDCKVYDVINCHCSKIVLNEKASTYIALTFDSCLCNSCLVKINDEFI